MHDNVQPTSFENLSKQTVWFICFMYILTIRNSLELVQMMCFFSPNPTKLNTSHKAILKWILDHKAIFKSVT